MLVSLIRDGQCKPLHGTAQLAVAEEERGNTIPDFSMDSMHGKSLGSTLWVLLQLWKVFSCGRKFSKQYNVGKLQASCSIGNCKAGSYLGPLEAPPRLELRFRRGEKMGFEGNVRCALEHNQQIGQESGSNMYQSLDES
jgi:hypothetical protein